MAKFNSEVRALFVNGTKVAVIDGTFNWNRGGKTREAVMGSGRVLGPTEATAAGTCSFDVIYEKGFDLDGVLNVTDAQIRVVWDQGTEWLLKSAFLTDPLEGSAPGGTISVTYTGDPWLTTKA